MNPRKSLPYRVRQWKALERGRSFSRSRPQRQIPAVLGHALGKLAWALGPAKKAKRRFWTDPYRTGASLALFVFAYLLDRDALGIFGMQTEEVRASHGVPPPPRSSFSAVDVAPGRFHRARSALAQLVLT